MPSFPGLGRYSSSVLQSSSESNRDRSMSQPVDISLTLRKWRDTSVVDPGWGASSTTGSHHWEPEESSAGRSAIPASSYDTYRYESRSREVRYSEGGRVSEWSDMDRKSSRWEHDVPTMERPIVRDYAEEYRYENRETPPLHRWNAMEKRMSPGRDTGSSRGGGTSSRWESAESYSRDARMSDIFSREYESGLKDGGKARASRWDPVAPLPSGSGSLSQKIGSTSHLPSSGRSASKHSSSSTSDVPYRAVESSDKTDSALDSFGILAEGLSPRSSDSSTRLALFVAFKKFGKISELQIHGSGESRYGLIFFRHQYSQETALKAMQGKDFFGTPLKLLPWTLPVPEKDEKEPLPNQDVTVDKPGASRYLLVQNVDPRTRDEHMQKLFQDFGEVLDIKVEQSEGRTKYVVVEFANIASVCKAINEVDGYKGLRLSFEPSKPTVCMWMGDLPKNITEEYLMQISKLHGQVSEIILDKVKGEALIIFHSIEETERAVQAARKKKIFKQKVVCDFASANLRLAFYRSMEATGQERKNVLAASKDKPKPNISAGVASQMTPGKLVPPVPAPGRAVPPGASFGKAVPPGPSFGKAVPPGPSFGKAVPPGPPFGQSLPSIPPSNVRGLPSSNIPSDNFQNPPNWNDPYQNMHSFDDMQMPVSKDREMPMHMDREMPMHMNREMPMHPPTDFPPHQSMIEDIGPFGCPSMTPNMHPFDNPCMPFDNPRMPFDNPCMPFDQARMPFDHPRMPFDHPRMPFDQPRMPFDQPRMPFDQPRMPFDQPCMPFDQPRMPFDQPHMPFDQPRMPFDQPRMPFDQPRMPFNNPRMPFDQPRMPFDQPRMPFDQPRMPFDHPRMPFNHPRMPFSHPRMPFDHPHMTQEENPYSNYIAAQKKKMQANLLASPNKNKDKSKSANPYSNWEAAQKRKLESTESSEKLRKINEENEAASGGSSTAEVSAKVLSQDGTSLAESADESSRCSPADDSKAAVQSSDDPSAA